MDGVAYEIAFTATITGAMAKFEGRSWLGWTIAGGVGAFAAAIALGRFAYACPVFVLVPAYLVLWVLSRRDDEARRNRPRGGIVK